MPEIIKNRDKNLTKKGEGNQKNHVFLKGQNTLKYRKGHQKQGFRTMSARTGKVPKNTKNEVEIHPEIYEKTTQK